MIIAICSTYKKDKKSEKQLAKNEESLSKLPDIYYKAKDLPDWFASDEYVLEVFQYISNNRTIYLKMKKGSSIVCPIADLDVRFDKIKISPFKKVYYITCKNRSNTINFYGYDEVFTSKQWEVIYSTLTLAGVTRNVSIMGSAYKNMEKAAAVLKIIKALS